MDDFVKFIKVIRFRTSDGRYLTAHEDQEGLALRKPAANGPVPENTEWRVMWLGPGKCCFKSIYGKALTVRRGWFVVWVNQEPWPVLDGAGDWYLQITNQSSSREFQAKLIPVNDSSYSLEATDYGVFLSSTTWPYLRSLSGWTVEVVKSNNGQKSKQKSKQQHPWQVGQVIYNVSNGAGGGQGGGFSHLNSGHNVNGSGTQTNGDVNVHTEIGRQGNVSVNFTNNHH